MYLTIGIAYKFDASQRNTIFDSPMGEISNQIQRDAIVTRNVFSYNTNMVKFDI